MACTIQKKCKISSEKRFHFPSKGGWDAALLVDTAGMVSKETFDWKVSVWCILKRMMLFNGTHQNLQNLHDVISPKKEWTRWCKWELIAWMASTVLDTCALIWTWLLSLTVSKHVTLTSGWKEQVELMGPNVWISAAVGSRCVEGKEPARKMKGMAVWEVQGGGENRRHFLLFCS